MPKKLRPPPPASNHDHDALFSTALSDPRIIQDFLQQYLPPALLAALDLTTVEVCKDKFIDENLDSRYTDMLYRIKLKNSGQDAYIAALVEHRSTPQKQMPLRVLHYTCSVMKGHLKLYGRVPLVFSLVYYNGEKRWRYSKDIKTLIDAPAELIEQYALKPFQLVDLSQISDEALRDHIWSGLLSHVMKHIYDQDLLPVLEDIMTWLKDIEQHGGHDFVRSLVYYIYKRGSIRDETKFQVLIRSQLSEEIGAEIMTLAQQHTEQGRQEGLQLGLQQGIQQGIQQGVEQGERKLLMRLLERRFGSLSAYYLTRLNAASDEQLGVWSERLLDAKTLEDIFDV